MKILARSVYIGPSLYAHFPVIRLELDLGELESWPSARLGTDFIDGLLTALPSLREHGCSYREPGGFVRRLREDDGTWLGHILEHVALELQNVAGQSVTFGKTRSIDDAPGTYEVVYEYTHEEVGVEAGELALRLLASLLPEKLRPAHISLEDFDWPEDRDTFIRFAQRRNLGPSTASLVKAAVDRDIPFLRLNRYSLVQLGHGKYQRRIQATITSETRHIGVEIASDKEETNGLLGDLGLPVARQILVHSRREAVRAARRIGYPVVVKPLDANHGRGVSIHLTEDEQVAAGFDQAQEHSRTVMVESFIVGLDHRLLVVDGKLVAASKRVPGHVVGDGEHRIEQLIEIVNSDPRRGIGHEKVLTRLEVDHQAKRLMSNLGYDETSVPPVGEVVYLRSTANLSTGGTAVDVTDVIHPDNREMAERAARAVGLDVCGVDFLTDDISQSYKHSGGAICEVNAAPGFRMHVSPSEGKPRDVAGPVMDMLFPPGTPARIPIAAITGTNGKTTTSRMTAHILKLTGKAVGMTSTDGVYIDGRLTVEGDLTGPVAARMVLRDPSVDVAVMEIARGGLLKRGMGYRKHNVGAVLNVSADHLGLRGIDTVEQLAAVKRVIAEAAMDCAVLNADDEHCLAMASHTEAEHICYVTLNAQHPIVKRHIQAGGRAIVLEDGMNGQMITLYDKGSHMPLLWTHLVPATLEGRARFNVQNAMFAAAITYSMDVALEDIRHGLRTFDTTWFQAPGRMNVHDEHPFKVILDYGHNPAAVGALCDLVDAMDVNGRRLVLLSAPGDRRDEDIREIATLTAGRFEHYVLRRDDSLRGRKPGEVVGLLRDALLAAGVDDARITIVERETEAFDTALGMARTGDLLLCFGDDIKRCWQQITSFQPAGVEVKPAAKPAHGRVSAPELPKHLDLEALSGGAELVQDERGVRLARQEEGD
ncbi:MAG: cyanophycin synthetase [Planctomycetota bacterium]|nr:MAG: cyanophycin synthetase [Planctomycetota bacterium]